MMVSAASCAVPRRPLPDAPCQKAAECFWHYHRSLRKIAEGSWRWPLNARVQNVHAETCRTVDRVTALPVLQCHHHLKLPRKPSAIILQGTNVTIMSIASYEHFKVRLYCNRHAQSHFYYTFTFDADAAAHGRQR
jgi:hypothetical protein